MIILKGTCTFAVVAKLCNECNECNELNFLAEVYTGLSQSGIVLGMSLYPVGLLCVDWSIS